jgi:hypothetical protein
MNRALRLGRVVSFILLSFAHADLSSFDFLNIAATSAASAYGFAPASERGSLEGLWGNPAALAGLSNVITAMLSHQLHLGVNLLSGGLAWGTGVVRFSGGISILLPGELVGASLLQDAPKTLEGAGFHYIGATALRFGQALSLPFHMDFGASIHAVSEVLDTKTIAARYVDLGLILGFPIGRSWEIQLGADAKRLAFHPEGGGSSMPTSYSVGARVRAERSWFLVALQGQMNFSSNATRNFNLGLDITLANRFFLKGGMSFLESSLGFSAGMGVRLMIPGHSALRVDAAILPGQLPEGGGVYQITGFFSEIPDIPIRPSPVRGPGPNPVMRPRVGMLIDEGIYDAMEERVDGLMRAIFPKHHFIKDDVLRTKSEGSWMVLDPAKYGELARRMNFAKILVVLRSREDEGGPGRMFIFNSKDASFEAQVEFETNSNDKENASMVLAKIRKWQSLE